jgi:hypothetical protein
MDLVTVTETVGAAVNIVNSLVPEPMSTADRVILLGAAFCPAAFFVAALFGVVRFRATDVLCAILFLLLCGRGFAGIGMQIRNKG